MRHWCSRVGLLLVGALVVALVGAATTTVWAGQYTYDAPHIAHAGTHAPSVADVRRGPLGHARQGRARPDAEVRGTSTTSLSRGVATEAGAGADNVVNGVRLRAQLTGEEIAGGHAFDKHVLELGEFPGVTTRAGFASTIEDVVMKGEMRVLSNGRTAFWNDGVVVIRNAGALDGGTAFRPTDGFDYFLGLT